MPRLIARLLLLLSLLMPLAPAFGQMGPMRSGPAVTQAAPEESNRLMRWLAAQQRDAAFQFRRLLIDLRDGQNWLTLMSAVGLAFLYGVFHAAGPGHGKMLVISYFLSRRARLSEGLRMGVRIALTHVASALAIVAVLFLLFDGRPAPDFESTREVRLIAYAGIIALGLWFLIEAGERLRRGSAPAACGHDHGHGHENGHGPASPLTPPLPPREFWRARLTGWMAGAVPCTGAIIILVFCAANGLWLTGLLMVSAIAVGMALTMTSLGVLTLVAHGWVGRWAERRPQAGFWSHVIALAGPAFVTLGGMVLLALTL